MSTDRKPTSEKDVRHDKRPAEFLAIGRVYTTEQFLRKYTDHQPARGTRSLASRIRKRLRCTREDAQNTALRRLPIVRVLGSYDVRSMLVPDLLAGVSVAVLHIPMGMGFSLLASLTPIYGLYTSFFPVLMYALLGTSPHTSFGSNAVIAVLVGGIVNKQTSLNGTASDLYMITPSNFTGPPIVANDAVLEYKASVAAAASLVVGIILATMGFLKLGVLTVFFSDSLVSGFTFGASLQIGLLQLPKLLGMEMPPRSGIFRFTLTLQDIVTAISATNMAALTMSLVCLVALLVVKEFINERFKSKLLFPIPIDFIVCLATILVSHFAQMSTRYDLPVVNEIPTGVAPPRLPAFKTIPSIAMDSLVIVILVFALSMSIAKLLSKQWQYDIDEDQELIAYGGCNVLGAFFQCFPSCQAPPRAMMAASLKARTTVTGLFSAAVVLVVLLVLGQFMSSLPVCALAAMIIVSLSRLYKNILDVPRYWKLNKYDFVIWLVTAFVTVFIDMDIGVYAGIVTSLVTVVLQIRKSRGILLGKTDDEDYFTRLDSSKGVSEIPGIKIFQFGAPLFFGNAELFRESLYRSAVDPDLAHHRAEVNVPGQHHKSRDDLDPGFEADEETLDNKTPLTERPGTNGNLSPNHVTRVHSVILDLSSVTFVDATAVKTLELVAKSYDIVDVDLVLTGCCPLVYGSVRKVDYFGTLPESRFPRDIQSAILLLERETSN